ncbi:MAG: OsmC family protein [Halorubrum sp.]
MATTERQAVNGVDVAALEGAVETISGDSNVGMFTFRAETDWEDALKSVTRIDEFDQAGETVRTREFTLRGDEPEQILGERTAPNAVELLLGALGSCLSVGYAANAAHMGIELDGLRFEMAGDVDLRGFLGISEDVRPGYESITCTAHVDADAPEDELAELRERVEKTSPLVDVIANGVPLETRFVAE